ncbi:MAG: MerR family transcriptional regulator [Paracoccaceae bacterium]
MSKAPEAFRTISEVAEFLDTPAHVLRFWESRFTQIKPVKRAGGRRYYRPADVALLGGIKKLLHDDGITIRGVQKLLREQGVHHVAGLAPSGPGLIEADSEKVIEARAIPVLADTDNAPDMADDHDDPLSTKELAATQTHEIDSPAVVATDPALHEPVAVTGFALESFVAKHGGRGLPLPEYDTTGRVADHEDALDQDTGAQPEDGPLPEVIAGAEEAPDDDAGRDLPTAAPDIGARAEAAAEPVFEPQAQPDESAAVSAIIVPTPDMRPPDMRTPEDAVAMVDPTSLYRTASALRRADPVVFENNDGHVAALYDRMRALRLRLAQDMGVGRR